MRELILKNLNSGDRRKREIFLSESYEKEGYLQRLEKSSIYVIKEVKQLTANFDLALYLDQKKSHGLLCPKQTYIIKSHDSKKSEDKFTYKICGDLYTIADDKVYLIGLTQYLKLEFSPKEKIH